MTRKSELGRIGEEISCRYLVDKRYKIIQRNFRKKWGEIDIIAKSPDKTLVFCEVKTLAGGNGYFDKPIVLSTEQRNGPISQLAYRVVNGDKTKPLPDQPIGWLKPEDQMTAKKIRVFQRTASLYAGANPDQIDSRKGWRLDLIAVTISGAGAWVKHYEQIL